MTDEVISKEMCYILRHNPSGATMDEHGWVKTEDLIRVLNKHFKNDAKKIFMNDIYRIVERDEKQRYLFKNDNKFIRAAQGHSIKGLDLELVDCDPPSKLYHGTTVSGWKKIKESGHIDKMSRHAVHMHADYKKAEKSATRWRDETPCILIIDAQRMHEEGYKFQISTNNVYFADQVPLDYILDARVIEKSDHYFNTKPKNGHMKSKKKNFNNNNYVWR